MERVSSGIKGLDEALGGGLPKGRCILVMGSPGSGKTTMSIQYLYNGAKRDERGLYVSLDEKPERVKENLEGFGWDLDELERDGKLFIVDGTPIRRAKVGSQQFEMAQGTGLIRLPELTLRSLMEVIAKLVEEEDVQRVVIDPMTSLMLRYDDIGKRRKAMLAFFDMLTETGCTTLVTTELRVNLLERRFQLEEFLSQGVILLHTIVHEGTVIRAIQIEKMRGVESDAQLRPYQLTREGMVVFPKDRVF